MDWSNLGEATDWSDLSKMMEGATGGNSAPEPKANKEKEMNSNNDRAKRSPPKGSHDSKREPNQGREHKSFQDEAKASKQPQNKLEKFEVDGWTDMKQFDDDHDPDWFEEEENRLAEIYGGHFIKVKYTEQGRPGYFCELCVSEMNAKKSLESHCEGMKHLKKKALWEKNNKNDGDADSHRSDGRSGGWSDQAPPSRGRGGGMQRDRSPLRRSRDRHSPPPRRGPDMRNGAREPGFDRPRGRKGLGFRDDDGPSDRFRGPPDQSRRGPPDHFRGPPDQSRGPPDQSRGPPDQSRRGPSDQSRRGPPDHSRGPPDHSRGPPDQSRGPPDQSRGPPDQSRGPPDHFRGPPDQSRPDHFRGPPDQSRGPHSNNSPAPEDRWGGRDERPPLPPAPAPVPKEKLGGGTTGMLLTKLASCYIKDEEDADLALSVVSSLASSLREYNTKKGEKKIAELLMEAELKLNTLKALKVGLKLLDNKQTPGSSAAAALASGPQRHPQGLPPPQGPSYMNPSPAPGQQYTPYPHSGSATPGYQHYGAGAPPMAYGQPSATPAYPPSAAPAYPPHAAQQMMYNR